MMNCRIILLIQSGTRTVIPFKFLIRNTRWRRETGNFIVSVVNSVVLAIVWDRCVIVEKALPFNNNHAELKWRGAYCSCESFL